MECPGCRIAINMFSLRCPRCNRAFEAPSKTERIIEREPDYTKLIVNSAVDFPPLCHRCGIPTNATAKIVGLDNQHVGQPTPTSALSPSCLVRLAFIPAVIGASVIFAPLGFLLALIGTIVMFYLKLNNQKTDDFDVTVVMPTCRECRQFKIEPLDVSWEKGTMLVDVHPQFGRSIHQNRIEVIQPSRHHGITNR